MDTLVESAIRATVIAGSCAVIIWLLRIKGASVRHAMWTGVVLVMLALPVLTSWGPSITVRILRRPSLVEVSVPARSVPTPTQTLRQDRMTPFSSFVASPMWTGSRIASLVYVAGLSVLIFRLLLGTWQAVALRRRATVIQDRLTSSDYATPVTTGVWAPRVILPATWPNWSPEHLAAVLAHEAEHVRRRDPLVQWLALLSRAVFWFNPTAWWVPRHLSTLAEEACDDAVLGQGNHPVAYAEALLLCAEAAHDSGGRTVRVGLAMPGKGLPQRIERILSGGSRQRASWLRVGSACVIGALTCATGAAATIDRRVSERSSLDLSWPPLAAASLTASVSAQFGGFEVASVKRSNPNATGPIGVVVPAFGRLTATNATLRRLVFAAYQLQPFQVVGGPAWANTDKFDINAKAIDSSTTPAQFFDLLKTLLADRFKLRVHTETREVPLFVLTVSRNDGRVGPKLTPSATACPDLEVQQQRQAETLAQGGSAPPATPGERRPCSITLLPSTSAPGSIAVQATGQTMQSLSVALTQLLSRTVVDRTGLTGQYDFTLLVDLQTLARLSADLGDNPQPLPSGLSEAPALTTQLQEDLGLKLDSQRGPGEVLVIDGAEPPTPD